MLDMISIYGCVCVCVSVIIMPITRWAGPGGSLPTGDAVYFDNFIRGKAGRQDGDKGDWGIGGVGTVSHSIH